MAIEKLRLLFLHPGLAPYRVDLFNELNKKFELELYLFEKRVRGENFKQDDLLGQLDFKPKFLRSVRLPGNRLMPLGIVFLYFRVKPFIVVTTEFGVSTLLCLVLKILMPKAIRLYTMADDSISNYSARRGLRKAVVSLISPRINGVIVPSMNVSTWYQKSIQKPVKLLEMPIIQDEIRLREYLINSLKLSRVKAVEMSLQGKKVFLYVGRLSPEKNVQSLIESFYRASISNGVLLIVGDGPMRCSLEEQAKNISSVFFLGAKQGKDLWSIYNLSSVFVLPSTSERYGAVVNEALISGCSVLCSNVAGAIHLIDNRQIGASFDPLDLTTLTSLLLEYSRGISPLDVEKLEVKDSMMNVTFSEMVESLSLAL